MIVVIIIIIAYNIHIYTFGQTLKTSNKMVRLKPYRRSKSMIT